MCSRLKGCVSGNLILSLFFSFFFDYIFIYQHLILLLRLLLLLLFGRSVVRTGCLKLDVTILRSGTFFIKMGIPGNGCAQTELIQRHTNLWGWVGKKVLV